MTKNARMSEVQWARLAEDGNYGVRRGAWYRVAELTPSDAVVDVNRKPVSLPLRDVVDAKLTEAGLFYAYNTPRARMKGHVVFQPTSLLRSVSGANASGGVKRP